MTRGFRRSLIMSALTLSLGIGLPKAVAQEDLLPEVRDRLQIEAQRLEKEFKESRAEAYKLVRAENPDVTAAVEKLHDLLAKVKADTVLEPRRRQQLVVTLEWDLDKVKELAAARRRAAIADDLARAVRSDIHKAEAERRGVESKRTTSEVESLLSVRSKAVADARDLRRDYAERSLKLGRSIEESALPESRSYVLPKDWVEKSMRRSPGAKMSAKEKALLKTLNTVINVDFQGTPLSQVIEQLEKLTGQSIPVDRAALAEVGATYDSTINLRLKATTRTVLKRILAEFNLAYVIKDEMIQVTSQARAREMTTTRVYPIADLATVVDIRYFPGVTQMMTMENANRIITQITQQIDPQSWKVNNPDAPGTIVFQPSTMSLIIKQTAEVHMSLGGGR